MWQEAYLAYSKPPGTYLITKPVKYLSLTQLLTEKAMAPPSSTLAWKIPWTEEPGRLQSIGSLRVGHNWLHFHFSLSCIGEGNSNPLQYSCLENPRDGGAWWAAVYAVAPSQTRLKRLSSSRSSSLQCLKNRVHLKCHKLYHHLLTSGLPNLLYTHIENV